MLLSAREPALLLLPLKTLRLQSQMVESNKWVLSRILTVSVSLVLTNLGQVTLRLAPWLRYPIFNTHK